MLSREDIVAVASRIFAIFLFVTSIRVASQFFSPEVFENLSGWPGALAALLWCVPLAATALLWFFPLTVARKLLPVMRDTTRLDSGRPAELEVLAFSVLGAWVLAGALTDAALWVVFALVLRNPDYETVRITPDQVASMWATGIELLIGCYLLFGARGLVGLLRRLRYAGAHIPEPDETGDAEQTRSPAQERDLRS